MDKLSTYVNLEPQLNNMESSKPERKPEINLETNTETKPETIPDYYEHYQPDWKLKIHTVNDQYEEIGIENEDFTLELVPLTLKYEENLQQFAETLNKDMCQRSLHIIQKRCTDIKLNATSNNNESDEKQEMKVKRIIFFTIFQTYLLQRIDFFDRVSHN